MFVELLLYTGSEPFLGAPDSLMGKIVLCDWYLLFLIKGWSTFLLNLEQSGTVGLIPGLQGCTAITFQSLIVGLILPSARFSGR